jgi:hypothetical protein
MPDNNGELTGEDVESFTKGRLLAGDELTTTLLAAAVADVRAYCGWHVCPVRADHTIVLDGPGSQLLVLPTLRMTALTTVVEDGVELDVTTLAWSTRGLVRKKSGAQWSGEFGSIEVTFTHGYTPDEAADWTLAVLSAVDRNARVASNEPIAVGPFRWSESTTTAEDRATLDHYRLEKPA